VPYPDWRTNASKEIREQCVLDGRVPLLPKDYELVQAMRRAIEHSDAAEYFFGEGVSEVSYTWEHREFVRGPSDPPGPIDAHIIACKARADRIVPGAIIDLKTAMSASPQAFQRAMVRDGHHLRAAWYIDGWCEQHPGMNHRDVDYLYVVPAKTEPHLVSIFKVDDVDTVFEPGFEQYDRVSSLERGRQLYRKALSEIRTAREEGGLWRGYAQGIKAVSLPAFAEHQLADMEAEGEL
jgi:hypothetical protein